MSEQELIEYTKQRIDKCYYVNPYLIVSASWYLFKNNMPFTKSFSIVQKTMQIYKQQLSQNIIHE